MNAKCKRKRIELQELTNSDVENVLTCNGHFSCRTRKRPLDDLQPGHVSKLRFKAAKLRKNWCKDGVLNDIWKYVVHTPDLVSKFSLQPSVICETEWIDNEQINKLF